MMTWVAFGVGAVWLVGVRRLLAEAALARRAWARWRRSPYPAQVEDSESALFTTIVLAFLAATWTGAMIALILLLEKSFE